MALFFNPSRISSFPIVFVGCFLVEIPPEPSHSRKHKKHKKHKRARAQPEPSYEVVEEQQALDETMEVVEEIE